jgi:hypothetical protein
MKLQGVHWVLLAAAWSVAVSPATEPVVELGDAAGGEAIGVVWHDQATVAPAVQQRLVDELIARAGSRRAAVVADASTLARARVALELPRPRLDVVAGWRSLLDEASTAYRAGQLPAARLAVSGLLEVVQADPVVPGSAALAWRAHVLRAQLSWAEGDTAGLEQAIAAAVALDPEAKPSTRQVPPPVVEAYLRQREAVLAEAASWPSLTLSGPPGVAFAVEIDGVPGRRPVPPGEHLVVVRRPGVAPVGAVVHTSTPWAIPDEAPVLRPGLPLDREAAQRICESAEVGWLVLARLRDDRLGLQRYACGAGFGPAWYEARDGWVPGLDHVIAGPHEGFVAEPVLHGDQPWPAVPPPPRPRPVVSSDGYAIPYRARLLRALPWVLIGGAIAGAVTVGVLFGGDPSPSLAIDGNGFLRR